MANASRKKIGPGAQGKGSGAGAGTDIAKDKIEENMVLSNRDKSRNPGTRGNDSKGDQVEQYQENPAHRFPKK